MAKAPRRSPGVGDNSGEVDEGKVRHYLAVEILDQEAMETVRARRKRNRKLAEAFVPLADLDALYKMKDEPPASIILFFKRRLSVFSSFFTELKQFDLFQPRPNAPEVRAAFHHAGLMAGLQDKANQPPPGCAGDDLQQWQAGYSEGTEARDGASKANADFLAGALKNAEAGIVTDGTVKGNANKVGAQAAADFKADNPDVAATGGGLPDGQQLGDDFEAPKSELDKQTTRTVVKAQQQQAETPDPKEVEKAAAKLKESGFTAKPGKLPGEKSTPVNLAKTK